MFSNHIITIFQTLLSAAPKGPGGPLEADDATLHPVDDRFLHDHHPRLYQAEGDAAAAAT